jgi:hypothetical protein
VINPLRGIGEGEMVPREAAQDREALDFLAEIGKWAGSAITHNVMKIT